MKNSILVVLVVIMFGCDLSSSKEIKTAELKDIFREIEEHYSYDDYQSIMTYYDSNFMQDSYDYTNAENFWFESVINYDFIDFTDLEFEINDNYAKPFFDLKFMDSDNSVIVNSDEFDWLPKLKKISGEWKFYGNQNEK